MSKFFIQEQQLGKVTRTIMKDQAGRSLFLLVRRWGTRGDALSLYAMSGEILASIKQVSQTPDARLELYRRFRKVGILRKLFNLNVNFYHVRGLHWTVVGSIKAHQYPIYQVYKKVISMSKTVLYTGDYFILTVANDEDTPLYICIAAILDYQLYDKKKQKTSDDFELDFDPLTS